MTPRGIVTGWLDDLRRVLFPRTCEICGRTLVKGERLMCLPCRGEMPYTGYHSERENPLTLRLVSREAPIETAVAMFHYDKDSAYAALIQRAKYRDRPEIDRQLAREYAAILDADRFFDDIDLIVPVPMAQMKQLRRGYNQAFEIADEIGSVTGAEVGEYLAARSHSTQTRKSASERQRNVRDAYAAIPEAVELGGCHILVVDDVITTGATILSCCAALHRAAPTARLSVLSLAATHR
ncbi:MAG: ComF family protein [Muribaculaceae bacterium]|nr:ComF family protein [Muribaculaceae bacterium]